MTNTINTTSIDQIEGRLKASDCLAIFPEAKSEYVLPRLRELERESAKLESVTTIKLRRSHQLKDGWFTREIVKAFEISDLIKMKRELYRLRRYLPQKSVRGSVNQERISQAKEYPIVQLAETHLQNLKRCGKAYRSLCPYHKERTPSFYLYPDTNTFHCFGCGEHSDVIALTQKLHSLSFVEAVKYLAPSYESQ